MKTANDVLSGLVELRMAKMINKPADASFLCRTISGELLFGIKKKNSVVAFDYESQRLTRINGHKVARDAQHQYTIL